MAYPPGVQYREGAVEGPADGVNPGKAAWGGCPGVVGGAPHAGTAGWLTGGAHAPAAPHPSAMVCLWCVRAQWELSSLN